MTSLTFLNKSVDNLLSMLDMELLVITELMKDTSFPLEDRWEVYLKVEKLLPISTYYADSISILTENLYDDLYLERYQTVTNSRINEQLLDNADYAEPLGEDADQWTVHQHEKYSTMLAKRDEWREAVLAEGYGGFTNDW
jgi:hypothetical protein